MTAVTDQDPTEHTTKEAARTNPTDPSHSGDDRGDGGDAGHREDRGELDSRGELDARGEQDALGEQSAREEQAVRGRRGRREVADAGDGRSDLEPRGGARDRRTDRGEPEAGGEQGAREDRGGRGAAVEREARDGRDGRDGGASRIDGFGRDGRAGRDGRSQGVPAVKAAPRDHAPSDRVARAHVDREDPAGDRRGAREAGEAGRGTRPREHGSDRPGGSHARVRDDTAGGHRRADRAGAASPDGPSGAGDGEGAWGDGLIARRVDENGGAEPYAVLPSRPPASSAALMPLAYDGNLRSRLDALRELVGLSRARLDSGTLAEAGRVLDEAAARRRLSGQHTVVAVAGATGSGKSQLFNTLAGVTISETGVRRPTTAAPIACSWSDGAASLLDRLGIPGRLRRRPLQHPDSESPLRGLVLIDLPDHDSAAVQHREQVDRILALVDAVIWVVDPEKYADALIHERYLRPMAGHAEVTFVVLNQVDRLPGEAAEQVLDDLRRLLDEDGIALGEYGEPGATVLALSALTGEGVGELREALGQFVAERQAPARRIAADVDAAARHLRPVYVTGRRTGLSEEAREEFADRLADAVGATAAGEAAERAWLRNANRACGTPWLRLWRWYHDRRDPVTGRLPSRTQADEEATARQRVEHAVRTVSERASAGLPAPWAQAMREAALRGAHGLPEALDELAGRTAPPPGRPPRPGWWPVAVLAQATMTLLQVVGGLWLLGQIIGIVPPNLGVPVLLMVAGIVGGPLIEWSCRMAARGPARRYGHEAERLLREAAAGCGRARVLDPLAAELLRYREVREQYARVTGVGAVPR
ncbi:GTPase [Streptomyces sp. ICN988]|uniref:GTPase n=1 Tax=Streptomyces sp. ICN988 TaxID=2983765 RepID=UPI00398C93D3